MPTSELAKRSLLNQITNQQEHVLAAVEGLDTDALRRPVAPSGWSIAQLLSHLTYDDEILWVQAVLAGERSAIERIRDGWNSAPGDPLEAVTLYRETVGHTREILEAADLEQPPAWWPEDFPFTPFTTGWQCAFRLLVETATHAGHLDLCRELIDGHQHLVVG